MALKATQKDAKVPQPGLCGVPNKSDNLLQVAKCHIPIFTGDPGMAIILVSNIGSWHVQVSAMTYIIMFNNLILSFTKGTFVGAGDNSNWEGQYALPFSGPVPYLVVLISQSDGPAYGNLGDACWSIRIFSPSNPRRRRWSVTNINSW